MDLETLKSIVEIINSLGSMSKEAFMYWTLLSFGRQYLFGLIWSGIFLYVFLQCIRLGKQAINNGEDNKRLRQAARLNRSWWHDRELDRACKAIEKEFSGD